MDQSSTEPKTERRSERRVATYEPVVVTELGHRHLHPKGGLILDISGVSLTMKLPSAIASGTPVKVESNDMLMLGEVLRCEPSAGGFRIALILRHSLRDLPGLEKLNSALMGKREKETAVERPI